MFTEFENKLSELYRLLNGKKIIIWGWGEQGWVVYLWLKMHNRDVSEIIDNSRSVMQAAGIANYHVLQRYSPKDVIIIVTPETNISSIREQAAEFGYKSENLIFIREFFYGKGSNRLVDYIAYLDSSIEGVDIYESLTKPLQGYVNGQKEEYNCYAPHNGMMLEYILRMFKFSEEDAVFDYGCGKGAALLLFKKNGVGRIGGIEYDEAVYNVAVNNMKSLNLECLLINGDAAEYKNIDNFNIFYMFDPFVGETFEKVISNITESYERRKRKIIFIYTGARCHSIITKHKIFNPTMQIKDALVFNGLAGIYLCE